MKLGTQVTVDAHNFKSTNSFSMMSYIILIRTLWEEGRLPRNVLLSSRDGLRSSFLDDPPCRVADDAVTLG